MDWKQRANDARILMSTACSLFSNMRRSKPDEKSAAKATRLLKELASVDPKEFDCGIVLLKVSDGEAYTLIGGVFGTSMEVDILEMMIGGKLEEYRCAEHEAEINVKH